MTAKEALTYLRGRVEDVEVRESRHRPAWTTADIEAVERLMARPASDEQIALARIEGRTIANGAFADDMAKSLRAIRQICRSTLGVGPASDAA